MPRPKPPHSRRSPAPRLRAWLGLAVLGAVATHAAGALAQADVNPPPPNVLLLVDTSGSMDYQVGSNTFPSCRYDGDATTSVVTSDRSRWIQLVEVLTGSINDYACQKLTRNSVKFKNEYQIGGSAPYDFLYSNPYFRPVSNSCVPGPGYIKPANEAAFSVDDPSTAADEGAIHFHPYNDTVAKCAFNQQQNGILDAFLTEVRFGLMTFDTEPSPQTNAAGLWSYFVGTSKQGRPQDCTTDQAQEVGVRNASAPPWEGRAVGFGNPSPGSVDFQARNAMIQQILLATRPYGATPIAGMLDDARAYFTKDTNNDPLDASFRFGPKQELEKNSCRKQSIVLLSDGQPNMDLRPYCEPGNCPYDKAESIAESLKASKIPTYVIGFALSTVNVGGTPRKCSSFTAAEFDEGSPTSTCKQYANDPAIQACCALNRIAAAGGPPPAVDSETGDDWRRAHFADNPEELRAALSSAIGSNFGATSRTQPVTAGGALVYTGGDPNAPVGFRFYSGFRPGTLDKPWTGKLQRERWVCSTDSLTGLRTAKPAPLKPDAGDDFVANVNAGGVTPRRFFTVSTTSSEDPTGTLRPNLETTVTDGAGTKAGTPNIIPLNATDLVGAVTPEAMKLTAAQCGTLTLPQCRDRYLKWLVGLDNGTPYSRCKGSGACQLIGDVMHSTPRVVGRPIETLRDESYRAFAELQAARAPVLYVSTNDGFLHAFKIGSAAASDTAKVDSQTNNELWAFLPPAVQSRIPDTYPGAHQLLLDGAPVVKDVVATEIKGAAVGSYRFKLERTLSDAEQGGGTWRTILVQSFGSGRPGYFALDVTDPRRSDNGSTGPRFLWQVVNDSAGAPLFGSGGATPLITTVNLNGREVAVAVLPGGRGGAGGAGNTNTGCARGTTSFDAFPTGYKPRDRVPCYSGAASTGARSLTIVRLDSGQIVRSLRRDDDDVPTLKAAGVVTEVPIDSPLTGQPVAYPPDTGAVADRVFIGDQDGSLWRVNLTSSDPSKWTMDLFFDTYPKDLGHDWDDGQPIATPPVMSVNDRGELTLALSTGEQEAIGSVPGMTNYVWSLLEKDNVEHTQLLPVVNWYLPFRGADEGFRVSGPISLFSSYLYFSVVGPSKRSDECAVALSRVYGMHYMKPFNSTDVNRGGLPAANFGSDGFFDSTELFGAGDQDAVINGVSIAQVPSCATGVEESDDDYFGYGVHQSLGTLSAPKFQLVMHTGNKVASPSIEGATPFQNGDISGLSIDLPPPPATARIDSWAAVIE